MQEFFSKLTAQARPLGQKEEREPLCGLLANPREPAEQVDQSEYGSWQQGSSVFERNRPRRKEELSLRLPGRRVSPDPVHPRPASIVHGFWLGCQENLRVFGSKSRAVSEGGAWVVNARQRPWVEETLLGELHFADPCA